MKLDPKPLLLVIAAGVLPWMFAAPAWSQSSWGPVRGAPQDWSNRHVLYSNPETQAEAAAKGVVALERWKRKYDRDPRYALQVARKTSEKRTTAESPFTVAQLEWADRFRKKRATPAAEKINRDWSHVLGGASGAGRAGIFPAKYSFNVNATPSCADDFVVYTTAAAGASNTGTYPSITGTFSANPANGQTVTIGRTGAPDLVLTASSGSNTGLNFQIGTNTTFTAANLATAIARNGGQVGVTASSNSNVVTVTALTAEQDPTRYNLTPVQDPNPWWGNNVSWFSWSNRDLRNGSNGAGQPTIIAFNQLYKTTCAVDNTVKIPNTFWSYNTGDEAVAELSPSLSLDGKQVAFVQRSAGVASLVLLKWSSASPGTVGAPAVPATVSQANYRNCTAPCMTLITFSGSPSPNNTNSSPYVDYSGDTIYVGDDAGSLHKFTGVFNGTPAEQTSGNFPALVSSGNMLSSPVYNSETGLVYVGSDTGASTGGRLHSVCATLSVNPTLCSTSGTVVNSNQLAAYIIAADGNNTTGIRESPILDPIAQRVYVFVESDTNTGCGGVNCKAIYQFPTNATLNNSSGAFVNVGRGQIYTRTLYAGTFDNAYFSSGNPASPTGALYVCGSLADGSDSKKPTLWKIPITNNVMGTPLPGPRMVSNNDIDDTADCSPLTQVKNGANEYLYASLNALGNANGLCSGACVFMYNLTGLAWGPTAAASAGLAASGGTGGIIVDNVSSLAGTSQIYYANRTSPGNAVQASQAGLQ